MKGTSPDRETVRECGGQQTGLAAESACLMAREAAETLAHRCARGVMAYPAVLFTTILVAPGAAQRLSSVAPCGLLLLIVAWRLAAMLPFDRRYTPNPGRWRRNLRAGVYCSAVVWVVFALQEMSASGSSWPTWMILVMTAGIASGATTSLSPDPPLMDRILALLLGPLLVWGLVQGGSSGHAIAIVVAVYLAFILAQARHNAQAFRQSTLDKQALREAGQHREALVNSIDGIVWEADPQSRRFTFVSEHAAIVLGYPVERWLTEPSFWKDHVHPGDRERAILYASSEAAAGRDYTVDYRMLAADGRAVWLRDIVSVGKEGADAVTLRGVMVDVTAQVHASEERNMLADALRTVREAVTVSDPEKRIVFVNDAFLGLYGYTRDEILSRNIRMVRSAKNPAELDAAIAEGTGRGGWQGELWNRRKDGSEFPISLSTSLVRDQFGRTIALVGVATDITQRKCVEDEWKRAKEAAETASRAKSEFLANLSHEIRTPMNGIIGMNQLLLETPLGQQQRRYAEVVRDSARFLLAVLNDVLDFSRIDAARIEMENVDFDLHAVTGGIGDLLGAQAQEKGLELLCGIDAGVPSQLRGDPGRLRQVLTNLVGNAVKFTEAGEVSLRVRLESAGPPAVLRFEVDDSGMGVPRAKQHLLFQPFSQVDASTTRRHGGTGLGLAIVRGLVETMGGQVGFEGGEGRGSCFWFTASFGLQEVAQRPPVSLAGRRVLVADRNAASRGLLARLLTDWGCRAELAADGETAIARLQASTGRFDAAIVDSGVTLGDGPLWVALCEGPHSQPTQAPPVVLLSSFKERLHAGDQQQGACAAITKPVKQSELGNCLASLLDPVPAPAQCAAPSGPGRPEPRARRGARLLVVEDNPTNREVAQGILEQLGYGAVEVVADGKQALEALARADFDLVLMDCEMPVMDGYEATRRIRRSSTPVRRHGVPIVAMTAYALAGDKARCLEAGMDDYIAKPVYPRILEGVLEKWLAANTPVTADSAPRPTTMPPAPRHEDVRYAAEAPVPPPLAGTAALAPAFDRENRDER